MGWNPGILAGVAVPQRPDLLFSDMHSYLAAAGEWAAGWLLVGGRLARRRVQAEAKGGG